MANLIKTTWLTQAGFIFDTPDCRIVADPYMSDSCARSGLPRMVGVPVSFAELKPDYVFFSHDHRDHFDEDSVGPIYKMYPNAAFGGPLSTRDHFKKMGCDSLKFQTFTKGNEYSFRGFTLVSAPAYHQDPYSMGMIYKFDNKTVYLSGDTLFEPTLAGDVLAAAGRPIDAVLICINGRLGNMSWRDAVNVVREIKPKVAVPMHWGLFAKNTEDPKPFAEEVKKMGIDCQIPKPGGLLNL